uniref:Uncharacterized protein n=1 Tax=Anguilla anguilla TaxID=7936 RepID=A0A0E9V4F4_ANGAN
MSRLVAKMLTTLLTFKLKEYGCNETGKEKS